MPIVSEAARKVLKTISAGFCKAPLIGAGECTHQRRPLRDGIDLLRMGWSRGDMKDAIARAPRAAQGHAVHTSRVQVQSSAYCQKLLGTYERNFIR
jgi:hypothetical protein